MFQGEMFAWVIIGLVAAAVAVVLLTQLSAGARLRRRLRKTRSPVVSKSRRPAVKFSVKTPKNED